jgi:hypothetical protein
LKLGFRGRCQQLSPRHRAAVEREIVQQARLSRASHIALTDCRSPLLALSRH